MHHDRFTTALAAIMACVVVGVFLYIGILVLVALWSAYRKVTGQSYIVFDSTFKWHIENDDTQYEHGFIYDHDIDRHIPARKNIRTGEIQASYDQSRNWVPCNTRYLSSFANRRF